jgi:hypothetical protein
MGPQLTYRLRDGVLFGVVAGKSIRLATARDQVGMAAWHEAVLMGDMTAARKSVPGSPPVGPAGHKLTVAENAPLAIYDYPGEYAQRFDGVDKGGAAGGLPNHRHRGRAVFVKAPGGGFYLHGPPPCGNPRCILIVQDWESLFKALQTTRQISIVVEI